MGRIPMNALKRAKGSLSAGGVIGVGFVGLDTYGRMSQGESVATALPKALVTNAVWAAMPGGYIGAAALMGVQVLPQAMDTLSQGQQNLNKNKRMMNGYYQENDAQLSALSRGMDRMQQARGVRSAQMMNHAKGRVQAY